MTFDEYQEACERTARRTDVNTTETRLANFGLGLAGEAGEVCDLLKKHLYHAQPLDVDKIRRELGDCMWYIATTASTLGITLSSVAEGNIEKLKARYPEGFDAARSTVREGDAR